MTAVKQDHKFCTRTTDAPVITYLLSDVER